MAEQSDRKHLSASQLEMFCRCPEQWRRRYLERDIIPPRLAMLKGTAVHAGAEHNMRQKIQTHQDLPPEEIVNAAVAAYETKLHVEGYTVPESDSAKTVADTKDLVAQMAEQHALQQAPEYQPVAVESRFRIELPAINHDVVGVIDLLTDKGEVVDFKTTKRKMSADDAEASVQLSLYAAASNVPDEVTVKLDVLIEPGARTPIRRQLIEAKRDKTDLPIIARRVAVVSKSIDAGLFPPAPVGSWWCSESWCGYWSSCPYVNSERIAASKQVQKAMEILTQGN